jgi:hypothetical protein
MRVRWWLVFLAAGVLLGVMGLTLLTGTAQFLVVCLGVLFVVFALFRRAGGRIITGRGPCHRAVALQFEGGGHALSGSRVGEWTLEPCRPARGVTGGSRRKVSQRA